MSAKRTSQEKAALAWIQGVLDRKFAQALIWTVTFPGAAPGSETYTIDLATGTETHVHITPGGGETGAVVALAMEALINGVPSALVTALASGDDLILTAIDPDAVSTTLPATVTGSGSSIALTAEGFRPLAIYEVSTSPDGTKRAPRPAKPFVTLRILGSIPNGEIATFTTDEIASSVTVDTFQNEKQLRGLAVSEVAGVVSLSSGTGNLINEVAPGQYWKLKSDDSDQYTAVATVDGPDSLTLVGPYLGSVPDPLGERHEIADRLPATFDKVNKRLIDHRTGQVSITVFGDEAEDIMRAITLSTRDDSVLAANNAGGLYNLRPVGTVDATADLDTIWETRTQADWSFGFAHGDNLPVDTVNSIDPTAAVGQ